jgi:pSer/pThr/pTyr-binding forkhead associated (FHA) protein
LRETISPTRLFERDDLLMKAELVPDNGDPPIPVDRDLMVVGRRDYCDIVIDHSSLSKRHCVLVKTDGLLVIRDLISTNGTKVKGQKIRWAALLPDDRITLGSYKLRVYLGPDDAPGPSELYRTKARGPAQTTGPRGRDAIPAHMEHEGGAGMAAMPATFARGPAQFAEPSAPDFDVSAYEPDLPVLPTKGPGHPDPLLSIVLDDDDDIIELE